jgi:16S rRNA (guanine966-N2)-methyltransferase
MYIIAGLYRHKRLMTPKNDLTRPTASRLRESLFNICQNFITDTSFLDLFAGSGAIGFEALSRGAKVVTFIDSSKEALKCQQKNAMQLGVESQCQMLYGDVFTLLDYLKKQQRRFDIIFADPPYATYHKDNEMSYSERIISYVDNSDLLTEKGVLFIEEDSRFSPQLKDLKKLQLIDSRKMGHSTLQRYSLKTD